MPADFPRVLPGLGAEAGVAGFGDGRGTVGDLELGEVEATLLHTLFLDRTKVRGIAIGPVGEAETATMTTDPRALPR